MIAKPVEYLFMLAVDADFFFLTYYSLSISFLLCAL